MSLTDKASPSHGSLLPVHAKPKAPMSLLAALAYDDLRDQYDDYYYGHDEYARSDRITGGITAVGDGNVMDDTSDDDDDDGYSEDDDDDADNEQTATNHLSGFDRINDQEQFDKLVVFLSKIQGKFVPDAAAAATNSNSDLTQIEALKFDVEYIRKNVDGLKDSPNSSRVEDLLQHLMGAADLSEDYSFDKPDSYNLKQLLRIVAVLKVCVHRKLSSGGSEASGIIVKKKKDPPFIISKSRETETETGTASIKIPPRGMPEFQSSYDSLTDNQKLCLLCFSVFHCSTHEEFIRRGIVIKKKTLIYWWVGEGLIDSKEKTIEEEGEEVFKALKEKVFIEAVKVKGRETGSCRMHHTAHSFVTDRAKRVGFFDFDNGNGKLTPSFTRSRRACLLEHKDEFPSSCWIWAKLAESTKTIKRFGSVQTLFNVDESVIQIKPEWFSKMKNLSVLHLGNWHSGTSKHHIEVDSQKFFEELKSMKQLKLLNLQGVSTIMKLPNSVCKLVNLIILDLKECHTMEELPSEIGSLKNLTHLDMTNCHLLSKLPKGIRSLSKLEVLKGFVVSVENANDPEIEEASIFARGWKKAKGYVIHDLFGFENKEVCSFRDLLKLEKLRELSIVVNKAKFPSSQDLKVFKGMSNLSKLKITWRKCLEVEFNSISNGESESGDEINDDGCLQNIEKLDLVCLPYETAPDWMAPNQLKHLQTLYIKGGKLKDLLLPNDTSEGEWKVETLRFRYLPDLMVAWTDLKMTFPKVKHFEKYRCRKLNLFPCDRKGVWREEDE